MNKTTNRIVLSGMLVAIGLLLPFITAHAFGIPGTILLPMHIPVFLIGLICGPQFGAMGGILIPILSSISTGMPPVFPMLPIMAGELLTYGLISGLLYNKFKLSIYPSLIIAMVCGRAVYGTIFAALLTANNGTLRALSVTGALIQGIPGIIIQLALIPVIVTAVNRYYLNGRQQKAKFDDNMLRKAKQIIIDGKASCVVIKSNEIVYSSSGHGVTPLITLYENNPDILKDSLIVDKVIGKAAATIAVLGGAKKVYGIVMSNAAKSYLNRHDVVPEFGRCISIISNRTKDGLCPLEETVLDIESPELAYILLKDTIQKLSKAI